jgi:hypothetical protein
VARASLQISLFPLWVTVVARLMGAQTKYGRLYAFVFQASANGYRKSGAVIFRGANREQTARTKGTNITEREELA